MNIQEIFDKIQKHIDITQFKDAFGYAQIAFVREFITAKEYTFLFTHIEETVKEFDERKKKGK